MTPKELEEILVVARAAAREAGLLVASAWRTPQRAMIEHKGANDLVTQFDRSSEELLRERLTPLGIAIVGEEAGGQGGELAFYIDPIDGTTNFVHGHPFWCVSIGLVQTRADGSQLPILGVVFCPPLATEWFGYGSRAERHVSSNGVIPASARACAVSTIASLEQAAIATGFPYDRRTSPENNLRTFADIKLRCQAVRRCGSAAMDVCLVADGTYDGYWEQKVGAWDVAGGIAIALAAGARVTGYDGGALYLPQRRIVATNGLIHEELRQHVAANGAH